MCELAAFNASHEMPLLNTLHKSHVDCFDWNAHWGHINTRNHKKGFLWCNAVVALKYNQSNQFSLFDQRMCDWISSQVKWLTHCKYNIWRKRGGINPLEKYVFLVTPICPTLNPPFTECLTICTAIEHIKTNSFLRKQSEPLICFHFKQPHSQSWWYWQIMITSDLLSSLVKVWHDKVNVWSFKGLSPILAHVIIDENSSLQCLPC